MPTYESLAAFQRQWAKLDSAQRDAFRRAVAVFIANLKAGEGGFSPELRVHKLVNTEIWSLTWANDGRALFRFGAEITPGQTHIIWEAIGTAQSPKSFTGLDGADHQLSLADASYAASVTGAWAARYLPAPEGPDSATSPADPALRDVVVVTDSGARPYGQRITAGGHQLIADEPVAVGGADRGPTPYDLLLAGLGACTAITVRMYADRKGWPLRQTTVRLRHQRIHAKDCASCETTLGQLDQIERELQFEGELTDEQRARLMDIAERCPVHRTLESEVLVSTVERVPDSRETR
jgi:putative redox protein